MPNGTVPIPQRKPVIQNGIDLAASGQLSSENGGAGVFDLFTSLGDVLQNTGDLIAGTTETIFGTIRRVENAKNPPSPSESATARATAQNPVQQILPTNFQEAASTDNLLVIAGVGLGIAGIILAIRG